MAWKQRVRAAGLVGMIVLAIGFVLMASVPGGGVFWSNGSGRLWGIDRGAWMQVTLMPGSNMPRNGFCFGKRTAAGGMIAGGVTVTPSMTSATTAPFVLVLPIAAMVVLAAGWRRHAFKEWQCKGCGYDRRGIGEGTACPECGRGDVVAKAATA